MKRVRPAGDPVTAPVLLFILASAASYSYCASTGVFSGDFFPLDVTISGGALFVCLLISLLPYVAAWMLYRAIGRSAPPVQLRMSQPALNLLLAATFAWHLGVTLAFQVGVMNQEVYEAPGWIKPLIQVGNRIDPFYVAVFFILASPKKLRFDLSATALLVSLGLARAGLGAFIYVLLALIVKYHVEWRAFLKRHALLVVAILALIPYAVATLYDVRASLRGERDLQLAISEILLAKLAGRLSSYSNLAYVVQEADSFRAAAGDLEPLYYLKQILGSLLSSAFAPEVTPEKLLINATQWYDGYSTYMAGVPGNLLLAWYMSPMVSLLNGALLLAMTVAVLRLSRRFANGYARLLGVTMLLYPLTSGVSYELASLLFNVVLLCAVCWFSMPRRRPKRPRPTALAHKGGLP
jgi:hypothetical protein